MNSNTAYRTAIQETDDPWTTMFTVNGEAEIRKANAINNGIPIFNGKRCPECGSTKKININSEQWSNKGHHHGECYPCYQGRGIERKTEVKDYITKFPKEKKKLRDLAKIRDQLTTETSEQYHIHHKIPVSKKDDYPNSIHNESSGNKIVVSESEHKDIHKRIKMGYGFEEAVNTVVLDKLKRTV